VLANDSDVDDDTLEAVLITAPVHITSTQYFELKPNGNFTYTPQPSFVGQDHFVYRIKDSGTPTLYSEPVTVTIDVLDADNPLVAWNLPVENNETYEVEAANVLLTAEAHDNISVRYVRFYRWDAIKEEYVELGVVTEAPYQVTLDAHTLNMQWNQVFVEAYDDLNNKSPRASIWLYRRKQFLYSDLHFMPLLYDNSSIP
jgi:hypothetical protein